jgi:hypothetical protein
MQFAKTLITVLLVAVTATMASPVADKASNKITKLSSANTNTNTKSQSALAGDDGKGNQGLNPEGDQKSGSAFVNKGDNKGVMTVDQAVRACGDQTLSCCQSLEKTGDTSNSGLLGGLRIEGLLGSKCSPMSISPLDLINGLPIGSKCSQKPACCNGDEMQSGNVVAVGCGTLNGLL